MRPTRETNAGLFDLHGVRVTQFCARSRASGTPGDTPWQLPMIADPVFRYKRHVSIDRTYGFIRRSAIAARSAKTR